jgi:NDP-sugar pyrophosphorylase family protein
MNVVIPMAGAGSRFAKEGYTLPKPLIPVDNAPMIVRAVQTLAVTGQYHFVIRDTDYADECVRAVNAASFSPVVVLIPELTRGAAESALLLKEQINNDEELIITNCDQIMAWDVDRILADMRQYDGAVVVVKSQDPKHSYVKVNDAGLAIEFAEKKVISDFALTGIHYWKKGKDFVASAEKMIEDNAVSGAGEFYVAPTYNYLIKQNKKIGVTVINDNEIYFIGTPADLESYESR